LERQTHSQYQDHLLVQYAEQVRSDVQAEVEAFQTQVLTDPSVAQHGEYALCLVSQLYRVRLETLRLSEQFSIAIGKLAEIQHLARVCTPEILADQLQELLDDEELLSKMAYPRVREEEAHKREDLRCPLN